MSREEKDEARARWRRVRAIVSHWDGIQTGWRLDRQGWRGIAAILLVALRDEGGCSTREWKKQKGSPCMGGCTKALDYLERKGLLPPLEEWK